MKKRVLMILATIVVVVAVAVPLSGALTGVRSQPQAASPQQMPDIPDLYTLLNYDRHVQVIPLEGPDREEAILALWGRPETIALAEAMAALHPLALNRAAVIRPSRTRRVKLTW